MAYSNTPRVSNTIQDGNFASPSVGNNPTVLILGSATNGRTYEPYNVGAVSQAEREFGSTAEIIKSMHEVISQARPSVRLMRIGGKRGTFVFTDSAGETLAISPELVRDAEALSRYALAIDGSGTYNRILIYDLQTEDWVYDTDEAFVIDEGVITVEDTGIDLFTVADYQDITSLIPLADLVTGDFTVEGTATATSAVATAGADGDNMSLVERYAALNNAYHMLSWQDADIVLPANVFHNDANIAIDGLAAPGFYFGVPTPGSAQDRLGYVWQYVYQGRLYTYFADSPTFFSTSVAAGLNLDTGGLVLEAVKTGVGGNSITIQVAEGVAGVTVTQTSSSVAILVTVPALATWEAVADAIEASEAASAWVSVVSHNTDAAVVTAATNLTAGAGGSALTHTDLTGDEVPAAVTARWELAITNDADVELREVNFSHQLGSFIHVASANWKTMMGCIGVRGPAQVSSLQVSAWAGTPPNYTQKGTQLVIDTSGDDGTGLLGDKFLSGRHNYRNGVVLDGDNNDGYAFGGLIKTVGASLPNALADFAYGVSDTDEELDEGQRPVDLGKYVMIIAAWIIHSNSFNGGSRYRGSAASKMAAILAAIPANIQPIGDFGIIKGASTSNLPLHPTQQDQLIRARMITTRVEQGLGLAFTSARTAAHHDSDYTKSTTIRVVNQIVQGVRNTAKPFIGKEFSSNRLISMKDAIDQYLNAERVNGTHLGASARIDFTRASRIVGALSIKLRIRPPLSLEFIEVETSVAADESEL